jgi:hypothetical protein
MGADGIRVGGETAGAIRAGARSAATRLRAWFCILGKSFGERAIRLPRDTDNGH